MNSRKVEFSALLSVLEHLKHRLAEAALRQIVRGGESGRRTGRFRRCVGRAAEEVRELRLISQVDLRWEARKPSAGDVLPDGAAEFVAGLAEEHQHIGVLVIDHAVAHGMRDIVDDTEHADHRRGQNRGLARLVVERDVAAGDGDIQLAGAIGKPVHSFAELPHHVGVLRGAEVQAVGHRDGAGTGHCDIAVRLGQCEARAHIRV